MKINKKKRGWGEIMLIENKSRTIKTKNRNFELLFLKQTHIIILNNFFQ